jgi:speckle-type POZ protein
MLDYDVSTSSPKSLSLKGNMVNYFIVTDVTFSVDAQLFRAHRCVLAARSSVFEAELLGPMKTNPAQRIQIEEIEPCIFEALLHFIYTDSLPADSEASENERMQHLLVVADRYGVERLGDV